MRRRLLPWVVSALLAACATPEPAPPAPVVSGQTPEPAIRPVAPSAGEPKLSNSTLKHLASRNMKPIPTRPLSARADCSFRDEMGYAGRLELEVDKAEVRRFNARVDIPKRGSCQFALENFRQTTSSPTVVLTSRQTSCKVNFWEQADQVTVAFRDCRRECSGNSVDYLWPILVDNSKGQCS